ncbi:MAG: RNA polymerase sigma factor [Myxococcota bacterium]
MSPAAKAKAPEVADDELARRAQGGDRDALAALLERHAADIYKLCHHVAGPNDGKDAAQQSLEKMVLRIKNYDPKKGAFRTWALTVARNTCRDRLRRRNLERATFARDGDERTATAPGRGPGPERLALARLEAGALSEALQTLPEKMRSAIVLFHVHGASYEEIATTLEVPKGTVMTWLHRGRRRLREALTEAAG